MPIPKAQEVKLSDVERQGLEKLVKRHQVGQQIALRARIVLAAADGLKNKEIVAKYAVTADTTRLWRNRWVKLQDITGGLAHRRTFARCPSSGSASQDHGRPALSNRSLGV